ncbi:MAG: hypothetical protein DRN07_02505 [Thermoplasmata archaeon]|nr:MAG: hypothetical protein DRN07_02505 [Thermoplasmata archaeon]
MKRYQNMKKIVAPLGMALLFIATQLIAVFVAPPFKEAGFETFENPDDPLNIIYIFFVILAFTAVILLIARYRKDAVKYLILLLFFISALSIFDAFFYFLNSSFSSILALAVALGMLVLLIKHPEWYVVDFFGVFLAGGIAALFAISLSIELIVIFLVALAVYDALSVYKTKHMVTLAETLTSSNLPLLLVVPKKASFSYKKPHSFGGERDAVYMGLGDLIIPGILITFAYLEKGLPGFGVTLLGALVGYVILMLLVARGPQPGLPYLNGGAIIAYALVHFL